MADKSEAGVSMEIENSKICHKRERTVSREGTPAKTKPDKFPKTLTPSQNKIRNADGARKQTPRDNSRAMQMADQAQGVGKVPVVNNISLSQDQWTALMSKLDKLDKIDKVAEDIEGLQVSMNYHAEVVEELRKNNESQRGQIEELVQQMVSVQAENTKLKEAFLDLEARSMRDNLMFYNLPEEEGEDCELKLTRFIKEEMEVGVEGLDLARVHRIGVKKPNKTRPMVAKFQSFKKREEVRKAAPVLKGKKAGVSEQFPKEVAERRKELYPVMRQARNEGKRVRLQMDRLYIDGVLYKKNNAGAR